MTTRYKGFSGPIGSGKSMALCQEAIRLSYLNPGRMGLLGAPTYPMLREATQTCLFEILESNSIPYDLNKAENSLIMLDTKSKIVFRPVDEYERLRGTNLAWFGLDELTYSSEEAWQRLEGRLRDPKAEHQCGFAVWTPKGHDWVYKRFISNPTRDYRAILATPSENTHVLDNTPDFYDRLKDSYDERFYRQEVLGEYLSFDGNGVYSSFTRESHVTKDLHLRPEYPLRWALDFNVDPMCSVVAQVDRDAVWVLDEICLRRATTRDACEEFVKRYPKHPTGVVIYGDASGKAQQTTGCSDYDMIEDYLKAHSTLAVSFDILKANPPVKDRINLTNRQFRNASGDIGLVVDPKCTELIQDLEQVSFKGNSLEIDKDRDRMRTHMSDALGYLLWQVCKPGQTVGPQTGKLL
ncbi:MAG TPA: phage terminase large subunit [Bryobacteraceae bacterium]